MHSPQALLSRERVRRPGFRLAWSAPVITLALVALLSLGARAVQLGQPCQALCSKLSQHVLIFDESSYVDAAEVIAGVRPQPGEYWGHNYDHAPLGSDPNAEHPQGAKLVIAAAIKIFGNGPFAWRIGSLFFGTLAIAALYALMRSAGGRPWSAVGAAALMAADNLMIVAGRVGMLDVYALAPMILAIALYLRGRVIPASVLLAVAACMKETSGYGILVIGVLEVGRVALRFRDPALPADWRWRPALKRLVVVGVASAALFIAGLWAMGTIAPPYADDPYAARGSVTGGPFGHLWYIVRFAAAFTRGNGVASHPWQWLFDGGTITYWRIDNSLPYGHGPNAMHHISWFRAMASPPILALAIPALVLCAVRLVRNRQASASRADEQDGYDVQVALVAIAWFIGTWLPFELQSALLHRTSYFYYMVTVMPGIYLAVSYLASLLFRQRRLWPRVLVATWGATVLAAAVLMFPFVAIF